MRFYGDLRSGNCLKVKYTADHLGLSYEWVDIDITRDETRTPGFLRRAPMGQVPVVEFEDGGRLRLDNAPAASRLERSLRARTWPSAGFGRA